ISFWCKLLSPGFIVDMHCFDGTGCPLPREMAAGDRFPGRQMGFCCVLWSRIVQRTAQNFGRCRDSTTRASTLNANERRRVLNILESNWQAEMRGCPIVRCGGRWEVLIFPSPIILT